MAARARCAPFKMRAPNPSWPRGGKGLGGEEGQLHVDQPQGWLRDTSNLSVWSALHTRLSSWVGLARKARPVAVGFSGFQAALDRVKLLPRLLGDQREEQLLGLLGSLGAQAARSSLEAALKNLSLVLRSLEACHTRLSSKGFRSG